MVKLSSVRFCKRFLCSLLLLSLLFSLLPSASAVDSFGVSRVPPASLFTDEESSVELYMDILGCFISLDEACSLGGFDSWAQTGGGRAVFRAGPVSREVDLRSLPSIVFDGTS